jgi:hypothetical protein
MRALVFMRVRFPGAPYEPPTRLVDYPSLPNDTPVMPMPQLDRTFSVAPMMDWNSRQ